MSALPARQRPSPGWHAEAEWAQIGAAAPRVAAVMRRYLRQLGTFLAPRSVDAADSALRQLARWMVTEAGLAAVGDIRRDDIEDYKVWLAAQPRGGGQAITAEMLTFPASWLSGSQKQALHDSFAAFAGHPAYDTDALCADLRRFALLLGETDGEELFGEPTP